VLADHLLEGLRPVLAVQGHVGHVERLRGGWVAVEGKSPHRRPRGRHRWAPDLTGRQVTAIVAPTRREGVAVSGVHVALRYDLRCPEGLATVPHLELYRTFLEQAAYADANGIDSLVLSEHHDVADGYLPSPVP